MKKGMVIIYFAVLALIMVQGVVNAEIHVRDNLQISGQSDSSQPFGIIFNDGSKQNTSVNTLIPSVYDNNGQYLGTYLTGNKVQGGSSWPVVFVPSMLTSAQFAPDGSCCPQAVLPLMYETTDCGGDAYVDYQYSFDMIQLAGETRYFSGNGPAKNITFSSTYSGGSCTLNNTPTQRLVIPVVEVTNFLPFTLPVAMPLRFYP